MAGLAQTTHELVCKTLSTRQHQFLYLFCYQLIDFNHTENALYEYFCINVYTRYMTFSDMKIFYSPFVATQIRNSLPYIEVDPVCA